MRRRLQDKVGVLAEMQQDIVRRVFGAEGLAGRRSGRLLMLPDAF